MKTTIISPIPQRQIRANFSDKTIRVYQAYSSAIATPAIKAQQFVAPFKLDRMTWIKPSFFWMMYRSGWGMKTGQQRVLAIDISREGFEWALGHASLSHFDPNFHETQEAWEKLKEQSPVRIQWDPERDYQLQRLEYRSIQIGLSGEATRRYSQEWIHRITDLTDFVKGLQKLNVSEREQSCLEISQQEHLYSVPSHLLQSIGLSV